MTNSYVISAKAWQIHDVLQTLSSALPVDHLDDQLPVHGVVGLLIDLARQVANAVSDWAGSPTGTEVSSPMLDTPEVHDPVAHESGALTSAAEALCEINVFFEAILATSEYGALTHRLAELGASNCQKHASELTKIAKRVGSRHPRIRDGTSASGDQRSHVLTDKYSSKDGS